MSAPTSPFALPARLAAKADYSLIGDDERHFAEIAMSLERTISELTSRLDETRRMRAGSGQSAVDRDQDVRRLSSRLALLGRFGLDLCLGRMVSGSGEVTYVGRVGLTGPDDTRLLIDWRSPAAEPFFGATHADPMGLASRRRYRWTRGRISDYWDEVFSPQLLAERAGDAALDDQSAFIASLGSSRSTRMRDVLGTIQADQDAIIRAESPGALVIDGGPGTGKTVVALHRSAYLLYADPRVSRRGVLFVGPSSAYLSYVADVLPSLGEDGVQICTLRDLLPEGPTARSDDPASALKSDTALLRIVNTAVEQYETAPDQVITVETEWADVALDADDWADAFAAPEPGTPHNEARDQVWAALVDIVLGRLGDEVPEASLRRSMAQNRLLRQTFARAWPLLDPVGVIADLWSSPTYLRRCAPWLTESEIGSLVREDGRAFTAADLPFLDAARSRIGDPDEPRRRREREAALARQRVERGQVIDQLIANDDSEMLVMWILRRPDALNSLDDDSELAPADPDLLAGPFAHVVIDEAQELTDTEWHMLLRRCPSHSFTIVGDRAQASHGFRESWEERLARVGIDRVRLASLTVNYRTPREVMAEAEPVIRAALPDANVPTSIRASGIPTRHGTRSELSEIVNEWLFAHDEGVAVVIGEPAYEGSERVRSLSPSTAKGLEFDLVVLVDPEQFSAVDRYVAMTRATQQLVVLV